jgi:phosphoglucomutase
VATTHFFDRIARKYDLPLYRTQVGFKYIADLFLRDLIIFGGEESASIAVKDHLPEKDGILAGLLVAEMVAASGKSLAALLGDLFREYGERIGAQKDIPLTAERGKKLRKLIQSPPSRLAGRPVLMATAMEGLKLDLADDDWLLLRLSGTEPLIRCYAEAGSRADLEKLLKGAEEKLA